MGLILNGIFVLMSTGDLDQRDVFKNHVWYRVSHLVVHMGWVDFALGVPLPAELCLGCGEFGRSG